MNPDQLSRVEAQIAAHPGWDFPSWDVLALCRALREAWEDYAHEVEENRTLRVLATIGAELAESVRERDGETR